jgi:hypothetical protein
MPATTATTATAATGAILALDLGKYKSVACLYDRMMQASLETQDRAAPGRPSACMFSFTSRAQPGESLPGSRGGGLSVW